MLRNLLISDNAAKTGVEMLEALAKGSSVDEKVRLSAAQTLLGSAYLYDYSAPLAGGIEDDEPQPDVEEARQEAFDGAGAGMSPTMGPVPASSNGRSLSVTLKLRDGIDPFMALKSLGDAFGDDVVEARIGQWYG